MPLLDQAALVAGAAALGCDLSPAQAAQLDQYVALLAKWNQVHNLTAVRTPSEMLTHHLLDCLAVIAPLRRQLPRLPARALDVGSGAGLPGVVLCIAIPALQVTCVDTVAKKTAFICQVQAELRLPNLRAEHARVEQLRAPAFNLITSRALGSLADLVRLTRHLLAPGGQWMAMKGVHPADEIAQAQHNADVFHVEPLHIAALNAERCLVWMRPAAPKP